MKAHYAFKEQVAMVDFTYNEGKTSDAPLAKVYTRYVNLSDLLSLQWLVGCSDCTSILLLIVSIVGLLKNSFALLVTYGGVIAGVYQGWCWREGLWPIECRIHC